MSGQDQHARQCGNCTLCCKLLPQRELDKPANQRCRHQRHTGCQVYPKRPQSCRLWSCRWLVGDDTADLRRPDLAHYVVDVMPDFVTAVQEGGERQRIPVVQVWIDPRHRDAHKDPALRAFLERRAEAEGMAALIRYGSTDGFVLFPPALTGGGWMENHDGVHGEQHSAEEVMAVAPQQVARAVGGSF